MIILRRFVRTALITVAGGVLIVLSGNIILAQGTPLTVSISAPSNNATVVGSIRVNAVVTGGVGVQFKLDGANLGWEDTYPPFFVFWNTRLTRSGSHTLTAVVRDSSGNRVESSPVVVTIPTSDISITSPQDGSRVSGAVRVTAGVTVASRIRGVQFKVDGANLSYERTNSPYLVSWNAYSVTNGMHTLTAVARDWTGQQFTSAPVRVTVSSSLSYLVPIITQQPQPQTVLVGRTATFSCMASGNPSPTYRWQRSVSNPPAPVFTDVAGATNTSYTTPVTTLIDNGSAFRCIATNTQGSVTSTVATLTVATGATIPFILIQPQPQAVQMGQTATFSVTATGTAPLSYQWQKNGVNIAGATGASYVTPATTLFDSGSSFRSVVTNTRGSATSNQATLSVTSSTTSSTFFVTGYYPNWAVMTPEEMDWRGLTHVIHFAGNPVTTSPYFDPHGPEYDLDVNNQGARLIAAAHAHGVKAFMSVGGIWGSGATNMNFIASDATRVQTFVNTATDYARLRGYDGIEIDWEPPANEPDMTRMIQLFRAKLDNGWTQYSPRGELALAVSNGQFSQYNIGVVNSMVDQFNLMMYDMDYVASGWCYNCPQDSVGFLAPLHRPDSTYPNLYLYQHNYDGVTTDYDYTVRTVDGPNAYIARGYDARKLASGLPLYTRIYIGNDAPGQPRVAFSHFANYFPDVFNGLANGGVEHWDGPTMVPWVGGIATGAFANWFFSVAPGNRFYITYENPISISAKVAWAKQLGLGGVMLYELSSGWIANPPPGMPHDPLLRAAIEPLSGPDTRAPAILVSNSPFVIDDTQTTVISVQAADWSGVSSITIYADGVARRTCDNVFECSYTAGPYAANTQHTYYATAVDSSANRNAGTSATRTFRVFPTDTTPPDVVFTAPAAGATVQNIITVSVNATDTLAVARVELYVNGALSGSKTSAPYDFSINTWSYPNGQLQLSVRAYDLKNNMGTASRLIAVQNMPSPDLWLYQDSLNSNWGNWSWANPTVNFSATSPVHAGMSSISFTPGGQWDAFSIGTNSPITNAGSYSGIEFYVHGGTTPENLSIVFEGGGNYQTTTITTTNAWQRVFIPMRTIDPNFDPFSRIDMQTDGQAGNAFYIDDLRVVGG